MDPITEEEYIVAERAGRLLDSCPDCPNVADCMAEGECIAEAASDLGERYDVAFSQ